MAESHNLFALLDTEDDASTIVDAALAAVKAEKALDKKKPQNMESKKTQPSVNNHMMTKPNPNPLPHVSRRQFVSTKEKSKGEKPEREGSVGEYRKQTENPHPVANGNGHSNIASFQGNFQGPKSYYNKDQNNTRNYGGFQGNSRINHGGVNGYRGNSRGPNQYRNRGYSSNDLQGNNVGGTINDQKTEKVVDGDGWQIYHSRRRAADNQSQDGGGLQQVNDQRRRGNFSVYGGDMRERRYRSDKVNNGREEKSDVSEKELENVVPQADNGEAISLNGVESKSPESCGVGAGKLDSDEKAVKDSDETSTVSEGHKDSKPSKKDGHKAQVNSNITKKQDGDDDEEKILFTLKEYEKMKLEKRKALDSLKQAEEQRTVQLDKDFESMLLVEKKNNEEEVIAVKQNSAGAKKKDSIKGEKTGKVTSIGFLKPASFRAEWIRRRQNERLNAERRHDKDNLNAKNEQVAEEETKSHNNGNGRRADHIAQTFIIDANEFPALGGSL